jgi:Rubrerythrin
MKNFSDLSEQELLALEQELLALAITLEEDDSRIYGEFAHGLQDDYSDTAKLFHAMADEESGHRRRAMRSLSSKGFGRLSETPVLTLAIVDKKPAPARKAERNSRRGGERANSRKFSPGGRGDAASPSETGPDSCLPRHKAINGTMTAPRSAVPQSCSPVEEPIDAEFREISTGQESLTFQHRAAHSSALPPVERSRSSELVV